MIYLNGTPLNVTIFPDGTSQVWKINDEVFTKQFPIQVEWIFEREDEFLHLAQLKDLIDAHGFIASLRLKYLPYARQDKPISNTSTFALHTFSKLLNSLNFEQVIIHDPHSQVALNLIEQSKPIHMIREVFIVLRLTDSQMLCYPDKGAVQKYLPMLGVDKYAYGEKVRDQLTGNIISYKLIGDVKEQNVLIVDDICDGGMTFKLLAKDLLAAGAKEVNLFVTHGIFSKGLETLKESGINRIFTQDGEASEDQNKIIYRRL